MRQLNLKHYVKGWKTVGRFYEKDNSPMGFESPAVEIGDMLVSEKRIESVCLSSANKCRALSDWLLLMANELEKRGCK